MYLHIIAGPPFPKEAEEYLDTQLTLDAQNAVHEDSGESADARMRQFTEPQAKSALLALYQQARDDLAQVRTIFGDDNLHAPQWIEAVEREKALRTALYLVLNVYRHQPGFDRDWTHHLPQIP
ncbi:hypothetical protein [Nocardia sp. NPDC020380]|uniref:hypothetical protein n=1 Tax=Nocardia sp. NPDC020380 TaxID=3364309 RepID=UPI0037AAFD5D